MPDLVGVAHQRWRHACAVVVGQASRLPLAVSCTGYGFDLTGRGHHADYLDPHNPAEVAWLQLEVAVSPAPWQRTPFWAGFERLRNFDLTPNFLWTHFSVCITYFANGGDRYGKNKIECRAHEAAALASMTVAKSGAYLQTTDTIKTSSCFDRIKGRFYQ